MRNDNAEVMPARRHRWAIVAVVAAATLIVVGLLLWQFPAIVAMTTGQASTDGKICRGVSIDFFAGGAEDDTFANIVYNGAKQAQADLGPKVNYIWSNWDSELMTTQFKDAISNSPDAIAMMGHPGATALGPLIDEAERKGIIVTLQNVDIPAVRAKYVNRGFGYVGQALHNSGMMVADGLARKYRPTAGAEAIVFGVDKLTDPSRYERTKGIIDGLTTAKLIVHEITIPAAVQKDATSDASKKMFANAFAKYPAAKIVVIDHGSITAAAPAILKTLGKNPDDMIVAGFDLSANTVSGIKDGYIGLVLDQQPYLQGYLPILQACMSKKYGFAGLNIDTGTGLIDSSNVDAVASLAAEKIR